MQFVPTWRPLFAGLSSPRNGAREDRPAAHAFSTSTLYLRGDILTPIDLYRASHQNREGAAVPPECEIVYVRTVHRKSPPRDFLRALRSQPVRQPVHRDRAPAARIIPRGSPARS